MTKIEFFNILMDGLKDFPESKLNDIIYFYENKFSLGLSNGKSEFEIINELGDPNLIVSQYRNEYLENNIPSYSDNNNIIYDANFTEEIVPSNPTLSAIENKDEDLKLEDNFYTFDKYESSSNYENNENTNSQYNSGSFNNTDASQKDNYSNDNYSKDKNSSAKKIRLDSNSILRICIIVLSIIIFSPILTSILGFIIGIFGMAIGLLFGSIGILIGGTFTSFLGVPDVPQFIANFPFPVIVLFTLASIVLSIFFIILFYYITKAVFRGLRHLFRKLKSEGGIL